MDWPLRARRKGRLLTLLSNIRLGWKGLPRTNTLAYYENPLITAVKSFIVQAPEYSTQGGGDP